MTGRRVLGVLLVLLAVVSAAGVVRPAAAQTPTCPALDGL